MTTVAACAIRGVMCTDSQWSDGVSRGTFRKVHRWRNALYGTAGSLDQIVLWLEALKSDVLDIPFHRFNEVLCLRLDSDGLATWARAGGWTPLRERRWAVGTGGHLAMGAMAAGATPRRAVQIAMRLDANSGGRVCTYRLPR